MVSMGIFWVSSWHGRWPRQQHPLPHPEDRFTDPAPDPHPLGKAKAEIVRPYWVWKPGFRRRDRFVGMFLWIFSPRKMWKWDYRVLKTLAAFWGISPWNIWRILEIWRKHVDNMGIFDGIQFKSFGVSGAVFSLSMRLSRDGWFFSEFPLVKLMKQLPTEKPCRVSKAVQLGSKAG
jgi:hypothetical protein